MTPDRRSYYLNISLGIASALVIGLLIGGGEVGMTKGAFLTGLLVPVGMGLIASFWWTRAPLKSRDWIVYIPLTYILHCVTIIPRLSAEVRSSTAIIYLIMSPVFIPLIALGAMGGSMLFRRRAGGGGAAGEAGGGGAAGEAGESDH